MKKKFEAFFRLQSCKRSKIKIGDSMTFNIYGNSVSGIITNFKK